MYDPGLCPDAPDGEGRCDHCLLDRLDSAQHSTAGMLIGCAVDLRAALKLGVHIPLNEIRADEFFAMLILDEEHGQLDRERVSELGSQHTR